jgi:hypothetical protein
VAYRAPNEALHPPFCLRFATAKRRVSLGLVRQDTVEETMKPLARKLIATFGGIAITGCFIAWAFFSSNEAAHFLSFKTGLASAFEDGDAVYKKFGDLYSSLSVFGLALAAGLSYALLVWERRPPQIRIQVVYWLLLLLVMPLSVLNYWSADTFVSRSQQVPFNVVMVFLSSVCSWHLTKIPSTSPAGLVLKSMTLFFVVFQGILIPAIYSLLWWLNWEKAISLADSRSLTPGWISTASSIGALAVSIAQYRIARAKDRSREQPAAPKIVTP